MRRTPYSNRSHPIKTSKMGKSRMPSDYISMTQKLDLDPVEGQDINLPKYQYQAHLAYRSKASHIFSKRPLTTNRTFSFVQTKKQDRQADRESKDRQRGIAGASLDQRKRELWVSTLKDDKRDTPTLRDRQGDISKGKIYRGSSYRPEEHAKSPIRARETHVVSRYSKAGQSSTGLGNSESRVSSEKANRHNRKTSSPNGYLMDLIGRNLNKPIEQVDPNFFEYVMRFSYRTKKGYIPSNSRKINQDAYIMTPNINGKTWQHLFAICDGHGPLGHHVSAYVKNNLANMVAAQKNLQKNPKEALEKAFSMTYSKLVKESKIDMTFSGTTVISCYLFQNRLFCCNVGDSRAIVGKNYAPRKWKTEALSIDHKPNLEKQAQRIRSKKGRVQAYKDEYGQSIGPLRVWVQNDNVPGLAMTRSFGDLVAASVGVIPIPEIKEFTISQQDKILIIASDGVFQFLENEDIIDSLVPYYQKKDIQQASDYLLNKAHRSWLDNSSIVDDITFIMIFLNYGDIS